MGAVRMVGKLRMVPGSEERGECLRRQPGLVPGGSDTSPEICMVKKTQPPGSRKESFLERGWGLDACGLNQWGVCTHGKYKEGR